MAELWLARGADGKRESAALLARALEAVSGLTELPPIDRLPGGKPWFPAYPAICFNVSHSGPLALCGVGAAPIGVDVERVCPRGAGLPRYALSEAEFQWLQARGGGWGDFYTLWTLKEARVKQEGTGLRRPPRTIAVPLLAPGEAGERDGLHFRAYGGADWRAAACVRPPEPLPGRITEARSGSARP